ncbi:hypothetical protein [Bacillus thuringiensis]|nr:hypothetical protein [Bacillus thuringiensis]HEF1904303.1 hypothetical protein [Bacillus cereus]
MRKEYTMRLAKRELDLKLEQMKMEHESDLRDKQVELHLKRMRETLEVK